MFGRNVLDSTAPKRLLQFFFFCFFFLAKDFFLILPVFCFFFVFFTVLSFTFASRGHVTASRLGFAISCSVGRNEPLRLIARHRYNDFCRVSACMASVAKPAKQSRCNVILRFCSLHLCLFLS